MINFRNSFVVLSVFTFVLALTPSTSFAGGGGELPTTNPTTNPTQTPVNPGLVQQVITPTNTSPITPLQTNSNFYSNTTQYSTQGTAVQCGVSINGGVVNQNSLVNGVGYQVGITYNTASCPDYKKLKKIEQDGESSRNKIYVQGNIIRDCINQRSILIQKGLNPDIACKVPDLSKIESILH
jgi:hypothetical protein